MYEVHEMQNMSEEEIIVAFNNLKPRYEQILQRMKDEFKNGVENEGKERHSSLELPHDWVMNLSYVPATTQSRVDSKKVKELPNWQEFYKDVEVGAKITCEISPKN